MFQLSKEANGTVPKDQRDLKLEAEKTLNVLRSLLAADDARFRPYFDELLGLCQYGLVGVTAQPSQALDSIRILQDQILANEKGRAISSYMLSIAIAQFIGIGAIALLAIVALFWLSPTIFYEYLPALAIAPGLFVGVIFSSFLRCRAISFYDLHAIDADRFTPILKTLFALVIVFLAAAFLKAELFEIKIGKAQLSSFDKDFLSAFVFGAVVGVAQEAIITRIESIKQRIAPAKRPKALPARR